MAECQIYALHEHVIPPVKSTTIYALFTLVALGFQGQDAQQPIDSKMQIIRKGSMQLHIDQKGSSHWPVKGKIRRRCRWCSLQGLRREPTSRCDVCNVALCITCFKPYHIAKQFTWTICFTKKGENIAKKDFLKHLISVMCKHYFVKFVDG